jgi:UDP-N-acetylmuramyl pentapeptide phosphotransferase/UDP-N-acetylglucosamine-1-phosphate transferase
MWNFGHTVREIERSHNHVVIEETATIGGIWLFGGLALLTLVLWLSRLRQTHLKLSEEAVGAFVIVLFALFAL